MAGSPYVIDYRRSFRLEARPEAVWEAIAHPEQFESWWGWLQNFHIEGPGLTVGAVLHGVVAPPVPYRMRLDVVLDECIRPSHIEATVHGDLEGRAHLTLEADGGATRAEISWTIEMTQRAMRVAARVARPLLVWGHDRVVEMTVASFRRHLASNVQLGGG